jgi:hypothetical protein
MRIDWLARRLYEVAQAESETSWEEAGKWLRRLYRHQARELIRGGKVIEGELA